MIQKKPITSITALLLPFVTYLLTLPRNNYVCSLLRHSLISHAVHFAYLRDSTVFGMIALGRASRKHASYMHPYTTQSKRTYSSA
jgi:hypothetical protein